jgi:hypothetical protein
MSRRRDRGRLRPRRAGREPERSAPLRHAQRPPPGDHQRPAPGRAALPLLQRRRRRPRPPGREIRPQPRFPARRLAPAGTQLEGRPPSRRNIQQGRQACELAGANVTRRTLPSPRCQLSNPPVSRATCTRSHALLSAASPALSIIRQPADRTGHRPPDLPFMAAVVNASSHAERNLAPPARTCAPNLQICIDRNDAIRSTMSAQSGGTARVYLELFAR